MVAAAVGAVDDELVTFHLKGIFGGIEGFDAKHDDPDSLIRKQFHTVSLATLFDNLNVPSVIDYFSLDIEGAEYMVMEKFPFHKYKFLVLSVERPQQLRQVLEKNEYVYVMDHGDFGDELYVHKSIPNFNEIFERYATKPKPLWITLKCPHPREDCIAKGP